MPVQLIAALFEAYVEIGSRDATAWARSSRTDIDERNTSAMDGAEGGGRPQSHAVDSVAGALAEADLAAGAAI